MKAIWNWLYRHEKEPYETYETDQPWMVNSFFVVDWLTRVLGRSAVRVECCICGDTTFVEMQMKRFGDVASADLHPNRVANKQNHLHPELAKTPYLWAKPLRNPAVLSR